MPTFYCFYDGVVSPHAAEYDFLFKKHFFTFFSIEWQRRSGLRLSAPGVPREREILPRDKGSAKSAGGLYIQFNVLTLLKSIYLYLSSFTLSPA